MASAIDRFISDAVGTMRAYFKIGPTGPRLKNSTGKLDVRDTGDANWATIEVKDIKILGSNAANGLTIQVPGSMSNRTITWPDSDGSSNYALITDGAGTLSWAAVALGANEINIVHQAFTQATSSPLTIFTPPANARINKVIVKVLTAAAGGSPTISVGVSGTVEREMAAAEVDLKTVALYEVTPLTDVTGSPVAVIATIVVSAQTFTGDIWVEYSVS